jgi:hypothetical protein
MSSCSDLFDANGAISTIAYNLLNLPEIDQLMQTIKIGILTAREEKS